MGRRSVPNSAQVALPGMGFAEQCIARCRALFKRDEIRDPDRLDAGAFLWECAFDQRDRRFACRLARLPVELADRDWRELASGERAKLVLAVHGVEQWATRNRRALERLRQERAA